MFQPETGLESLSEENRLRREEKKLQRQKELEARRAQRQSAGPMKLGSKKHHVLPEDMLSE